MKHKKADKPIVQAPLAQTSSISADYIQFSRFAESRDSSLREAKLYFSVNREQIVLYWRLGKQILAKEEAEGWGAKVVVRLADDLRSEFPEMTGLSARNLRYMKTIAGICPDEQILQTVFAKLSWSHTIVLLDKVDDIEIRLWYAPKVYRERLEPECTGASDRKQAFRAAG